MYCTRMGNCLMCTLTKSLRSCYLIKTATTAVIFFPDETKYSVVSLSCIKEANPKIGNFVKVKEQGKTHNAIIIEKGITRVSP